MATTIKCPHCGQQVELSQALTHEISEQEKKKLEDQLKTQFELSLKDKENEAREAREQNKQLIEQRLELNTTLRQLKSKDEQRELELQKRVTAAQETAKFEALKQASDEHRMKDLEKEKKISDMEKLVEELKRKAEQGSMQTQGEVLELDLEEQLKNAFPQDEIVPVEKGIKGADVRQIVKSPRGIICGVILWESKRTKNWTDGWLIKLKSDLRAERANLPALISQALPPEASSGMGVKDGVFICNYNLIIPMAMLLRKNLLDVGYQKAVQAGSVDKAKLLYSYLTSHEFRQQIEALAETYKEMHDQVFKERIAYEKIWKQREMQVQKMLIATAGIYGSMQGIAGQNMPQIKGLDLPELETGESNQPKIPKLI